MESFSPHACAVDKAALEVHQSAINASLESGGLMQLKYLIEQGSSEEAGLLIRSAAQPMVYALSALSHLACVANIELPGLSEALHTLDVTFQNGDPPSTALE